MYNYGEIGLIACIIPIFLMAKWRKQVASLLIWIWAPLIFFSLVETKMQGYIYFASAPIFILSSWLIVLFWQYLSGRYNYLHLNYIVVFLLFISPTIRLYESLQISRMANDKRNVMDFSYRASWNSQTIVFGSNYPINDMFFSEAKAVYEVVPDQGIIDSLKQHYRVVIVD